MMKKLCCILGSQIVALALISSANAQETLTVAEAMSDEFPDTLFVVSKPKESRGKLNLARSGGLQIADDFCLGSDNRSRSGRIWFTYNNRGPIAGKKDALAVLIAKHKMHSAGATPAGRVSVAAFRNSNPWYRGRVSTYFKPSARPLRNTTLAAWNAAHESERTTRYDRLFGRKPGDRFHASPAPDVPSSSTDSAWWALPQYAAGNFDELVVDARLLRFSRAGFEQSSASGVSFFLSPGRFDTLTVKIRSDDQSSSRQFEFELSECE